MKRLKHPIRAIREPFGTAGLIVAMIALVAALGGTAFAAAKLNSTQKKEVEKIAKKYAGKPGAAGANGANGSPGAAGKDGTNGSNGAPGAAGKSVVTSAAQVGTGTGKCESGGTKLEVEGSGSSSVVCNGKNGTTGFTDTLPSGKTEKGTWAVAGSPADLGFLGSGLLDSISFVIPLAGAPQPIVIGIEEGEGEANEAEAIENGECTGTVAGPGAAEGKLCVFVNPAVLISNLKAETPIFVLVANPAGATVAARAENGANPMTAIGTWAVTAE